MNHHHRPGGRLAGWQATVARFGPDGRADAGREARRSIERRSDARGREHRAASIATAPPRVLLRAGTCRPGSGRGGRPPPSFHVLPHQSIRRHHPWPGPGPAFCWCWVGSTGGGAAAPAWRRAGAGALLLLAQTVPCMQQRRRARPAVALLWPVKLFPTDRSKIPWLSFLSENSGRAVLFPPDLDV